MASSVLDSFLPHGDLAESSCCPSREIISFYRKIIAHHAPFDDIEIDWETTAAAQDTIPSDTRWFGLHKLARILYVIAVAHNKREWIVAVFLKMVKTIDCVWHAGLLYKLSTSAAPRPVMRIVDRFLQQTLSSCSWSAVSRSICAGGQQGICLSPVCYS